MRPDEAASALAALSGRVGQLKPARRDAERFYAERDAIADELRRIGEALAEGDRRRGTFRAGPIRHRGRIIPVSIRKKPWERAV